MIKPSIILIGSGGHARSCIDVIEQQGKYQIAGLIGMPYEVHTQHLGYSLIGTDNVFDVRTRQRTQLTHSQFTDKQKNGDGDVRWRWAQFVAKPMGKIYSGHFSGL